ncbi:MAG: PQQ-dependent sugar dehydrogenase [Caulobacterales bacterium]|nr:PQQ-dependent sugar dehydrogenase [Caulobacterales bacterium]
MLADPVDGGGRTSLARARLSGARLGDMKVIFRQQGPVSTGNHWGCRITPTAAASHRRARPSAVSRAA